MSWQYTPYVLVPLLAALVSSALAIFAWRRRSVPGGLPFTIFLFATGFWAFCYALQLAGGDVHTKLFWLAAEYAGILVVPAAWLTFSIRYAGYGRWLTRRNLELLAVEPLAMLAVIATNGLHGLAWSQSGLDASGPFLALAAHFGPAWWINLAYSYLLLFLGSALIVESLLRSPRFYRQQALVLLAGILVPALAGTLSYVALLLHPRSPDVSRVLGYLGLETMPHLDLTPFALTITGLTFAWALFRLRMLDVMPAARGTVFEMLGDPVFVLDRWARVVDANDSALVLLGLPAGSVIGRQLSTLAPDWPEVDDLLKGSSGPVEIGCERDGTMRWYEIRTSALESQRGMSLLLHDISERKEAEDALTRTGRRLAILHAIDQAVLAAEAPESIVQGAVDAMQDLLPCRRISAWSLDLGRGFATPLAGSLGDGTAFRIGSRWSPGELGSLERARRGEVEETGDLQARPELPSLMQALAAAGIRSLARVPMIAGGNLLGLLLIGQESPGGLDRECLEIAREVANQLALAVQQAGFRQALADRAREMAALYATSLEINAETESDALLQAIAERATALLGVSLAGIYLIQDDENRLELAIVYGDRGRVLPSTRLAMGEGLAGRAAQAGQWMAVEDYSQWAGKSASWAKSGFRRTLAMPLRVRGRVIGVIVLVDEQHAGAFDEHEVRLASLFADQAAIAIENARLYASLQETNRHLEAALEAKDEMIQNVSHELRTPLTHIQGYSELMENGDLGPLAADQHDAVRIIARQARRLHFMVNRLLMLQTFDCSRLRMASLDLGAWLRESVLAWEVRAARSGLQFCLDVPSDLPVVSADVDYLSQVLENLLDNAVKFSPQGGLVEISGGVRDGKVVICVRDHGVGIPEDKLQTIFERFYQVDSGSNRKYGGIGIGLALCRQIVEAHGGRIWAESAGPGQGTAFFVELPVAEQVQMRLFS